MGGGGGVNYRLRVAQDKYHLALRMINVFSDVTLDDEHLESFKPQSSHRAQSERKKKIKTLIKSLPYAMTLKERVSFRRATSWFSAVCKQYSITANDVLIFHDCESAWAYSQHDLAVERCCLVYHKQGSLYEEAVSFSRSKSRSLERFYNRVFYKCVEAVGDLRFPSEGAKNSLISSDQSLAQLVKMHTSEHWLYNGFTLSDIGEGDAKTAEVLSIREELSGFEGVVFITTAQLNYAKGVDRIPAYLMQFKARSNKKMKWIVVGDGPYADLLKERIHTSGLAQDTIWIKSPIPHSDMLSLFRSSDVYVLLHRLSIFDYATIEAMGCGNALLLTPVGGNKEVLIEGHNGFFANETMSAEIIESFSDDMKLEDLKRNSQEYENENFSEYAFLRRYVDYAQGIE